MGKRQNKDDSNRTAPEATDGAENPSHADAAPPTNDVGTGGEDCPEQACQSPGENLPTVESPALAGVETTTVEEFVDSDSLDAGETRTYGDAAADDDPPYMHLNEIGGVAPDATDATNATDASAPRAFRFAVLAATIALAAGTGSFIGSLAGSALTHSPGAVTTAKMTVSREALQGLKTEILAQLAGLKSGADAASRSTNSQFTKLAERLDSLERAQAEPNAKLAHMADALDRLATRAGAATTPDVTGSISAAPHPSAPAAIAPEAPVRVLRDWIVDDVHNGRALVENRDGDMFVVSAGSVLPGIGRVEAVKRQDGRWVVFTTRGMISSLR